MHALLTAAVDGIIGIDRRGFIQTINPAAERLFGYAAQEVIGQNAPSSSCRRRIGGTRRLPCPLLGHRTEKDYRYRPRGGGPTKNGSTFPMDLSMAEARLGEERLFVGIIRDITERKRAEEEVDP